jgi:hypothetical protein
MRYTGDIRKMHDNPTSGVASKEGLFYVAIETQESNLSIQKWEHYEITAENVTFEEGERILQKRLKELREEDRA